MQMAEKLPIIEQQDEGFIESEALLARLGLTSKVATRHLNFFYGDNQALFDNNLDIAEQRVTAIIGPSGCGKSTFLRALNRMNDLIENVSTSGEVYINGQDIYRKNIDLLALRKKVGIVFQRPNPFPLSIFKNVAYGWRVHGGIGKN